MTRPSWVALHGMAHSFIELDKAVVHVIRLVSFLCCGFSLSALCCPLSAPTVLVGFLLPWTWGISSQLLQENAAAAPYLGHGVSHLGRSPLCLNLKVSLFVFFTICKQDLFTTTKKLIIINNNNLT